jgi:thioredoxin reductase
VTVAVVGGGPAGLAAARELGRLGVPGVVVIEREREAGGIPRHAAHQGFGLRDLRRPLSGPAYARRLASLAVDAGAELLTETMVTGWSPQGPLELTGPGGRSLLEPDAVILASGCRERPRPARLVPGSRPAGVLTTGTLQQLVYLKGERLGGRAVVVGAEHVSFSSLLTLEHGGAEATAIVTSLPRHQTFGAFRAGAALRFKTPLLTRTAVTEIHGRRRVEAVTVKDLDTGAQRRLACDLVVFTADWIPDHEIAVLGGIDLDEGTRGPRVGPGQHTTRPGVFAAGNLLHGAETADIAALSGHHITEGVIAYLSGQPWPSPPIPIRCSEPLHWIAPNALTPRQDRAPARGRFLLRARHELIWPRIEITQDRRRLWSGRLPRVMPGRSGALRTQWMTSVDPAGGPVTVRVLRARRRHNTR